MRFLIALALLFSVTPGTSEVIEAGVHLIAHADLPHHESEPEQACSEHTCTPLAHHCSCHATMSAQPSVRSVALSTLHGVTNIDPMAIRAGLGRVSEPPPLRPPIG